MDNEVTTIKNGELVVRTTSLSGTRLPEKVADKLKYVTTYIKAADGTTDLVLKTCDVNGGGGDSVKKPTIVSDSTSTSISLTQAKANTIYKYGTLTNLTITTVEQSDEEIIIYFTAGATITATLPNTLQWVNDNPFAPEANTKYVISIVNNIGAWASFN